MWNRRIVPLLLTLLIVAGCGADGAKGPSDLADELLQAMADSDNSRWRKLMADDAVVVYPDGGERRVFGPSPYIDDDFDGDGVLAWADNVQFTNAMHGVTQQSMEWECEEVAPERAECRVSTTDGFIQHGGGPPMVMDFTYTFAEGKCVKDESAIADEATFMQSVAAWDAGLAAYQRWVSETHPESHDALFTGPCCEAMLRMSEDAVGFHGDLLPEFLAAGD